jgi:hypothetical protein
VCVVCLGEVRLVTWVCVCLCMYVCTGMCVCVYVRLIDVMSSSSRMEGERTRNGLQPPRSRSRIWHSVMCFYRETWRYTCVCVSVCVCVYVEGVVEKISMKQKGELFVVLLTF